MYIISRHFICSLAAFRNCQLTGSIQRDRKLMQIFQRVAFKFFPVAIKSCPLKETNDKEQFKLSALPGTDTSIKRDPVRKNQNINNKH